MDDPREEFLEKLNGIVSRALVDFHFAEHLLNPKTRKETIEGFDFNESQTKAMMESEGQCLQELSSSVLEALGYDRPQKGKERK